MIPFVRDLKFEYGVCEQVTPLIRRVVARNPGPFTFLGTGTYIIGAGDSVAVIDPGPDMDEHLQAIMAATQGERITHIFVTHNHLDHSPLARPLQALTGATTYGCPLTGPLGEDSDLRMEAGDDRGFVADVRVCDGGTFQGDGWTIEAIATPGHTSNHICYALHEENTLFSGDHIMGWSTTVISPPDGDMGDYFASLDRIKARNFASLDGQIVTHEGIKMGIVGFLSESHFHGSPKLLVQPCLKSGLKAHQNEIANEVRLAEFPPCGVHALKN